MRLTKRDPKTGFPHFPECFSEPCSGSRTCDQPCPFMEQVCYKLCALEDAIERGELPLPGIRIGQPVFLVSYFDDHSFAIEENRVNEVGIHHIWCSEFSPPGDDLGMAIPFRELGKEFFFDRVAAENELKRRMEEK